MIDDIEKIFPLEEILEIIDLQEWYDGYSKHMRDKFIKEKFEIDYVELEKIKKRIGDIGELFVYEREKARLENCNSKYAMKVDRSPAKDHRNGYDILSYTEEGVPIYIEVKSTMGSLETPFYITANEKKVAEHIRKKGGVYQIHRVYNIGKDINVFIYEDESMFEYEDVLYCISVKVPMKNKII